MRGNSPHARESRVVLLGAFAVQASLAAKRTVVSRTSSSEAAGGVVLGDKQGLLVSHLLCCFHIIPLEYISLCLIWSRPGAPRPEVTDICNFCKKYIILALKSQRYVNYLFFFRTNTTKTALLCYFGTPPAHPHAITILCKIITDVCIL